MQKVCPRCEGTGTWEGVTCPECGGMTTVWVDPQDIANEVLDSIRNRTIKLKLNIKAFGNVEPPPMPTADEVLELVRDLEANHFKDQAPLPALRWLWWALAEGVIVEADDE